MADAPFPHYARRRGPYPFRDDSPPLEPPPLVPPSSHYATTSSSSSAPSFYTILTPLTHSSLEDDSRGIPSLEPQPTSPESILASALERRSIPSTTSEEFENRPFTSGCCPLPCFPRWVHLREQIRRRSWRKRKRRFSLGESTGSRESGGFQLLEVEIGVADELRREMEEAMRQCGLEDRWIEPEKDEAETVDDEVLFKSDEFGYESRGGLSEGATVRAMPAASPPSSILSATPPLLSPAVPPPAALPPKSGPDQAPPLQNIMDKRELLELVEDCGRNPSGIPSLASSEASPSKDDYKKSTWASSMLTRSESIQSTSSYSFSFHPSVPSQSIHTPSPQFSPPLSPPLSPSLSISPLQPPPPQPSLMSPPRTHQVAESGSQGVRIETHARLQMDLVAAAHGSHVGLGTEERESFVTLESHESLDTFSSGQTALEDGDAEGEKRLPDCAREGCYPAEGKARRASEPDTLYRLPHSSPTPRFRRGSEGDRTWGGVVGVHGRGRTRIVDRRLISFIDGQLPLC
ncbi:uncharacterized protein VTP21DRAFT_2516 [Calcarisporiella thermophila]|uniref:uncharacterized protein n=1 Tax=Calcarisporiella thermophila TaxID=911321 RepID=UPI003742005C